MMNVLTTGVTGLVFWIIVARSVAPAVIAQSSAMVTQMLTVVTLSQQGLAANVPVLIAGARNPRRIAGHAYAAALLLSSTGAILFVTVAPRVASGLRYLQRPELTLLFVAGCVVWSIFSLQDAVLVGLMRSKVVLAENASWGVVRLIVVVSLPLLGVTLSVAWIVAAWVVPATALVTVISYFLFGRASSPLRRPRGDHRFDKRKLVAFLGVEQLGAFTGGLIGLSIPAVALTVLGARAAAPFLAAYSIVLVSENSMGSVAQTFAVEVRRNGGASRKVVAFMFLLMGGFSLFVIVVAQLFGENVMGLFGGEYRDSVAAILGSSFSVFPYVISGNFPRQPTGCEQPHGATSLRRSSTELRSRSRSSSQGPTRDDPSRVALSLVASSRRRGVDLDLEPVEATCTGGRRAPVVVTTCAPPVALDDHGSSRGRWSNGSASARRARSRWTSGDAAPVEYVVRRRRG